MSRLYEVSSKPFKSDNPPGTFKQTLIAYKIESDEDVKGYLDVLNEGVEILPSLANGKYVIVKKITKLPFDLHGGTSKKLARK